MSAATTRSDPLLKGFVVAALGTLAVTIVAVAGSGAVLVVDRLLREGPFLLLWYAAAAGWGRWPTRWLAPSAPRRLGAVTSVGVGFGLLSLLTLGLGTLGWLTAATAWSVLIAGTLALPWPSVAAVLGRFPSAGEKRPGTAAATESLSPLIFAWLPIVALLGVMLVAACVPPGLLWTDEPHGYDVVEYHLQVPREWYEAGRITPLEHNVFSYLPMNVEMHSLLAMHLRGGPWAGMYLAQLMNGVFVVVAVLALLFGIGWPAALLAAGVPWLTMLGSIAYVEAGQLMWATLASVWLLRGDTIRSALLAGVMAGFCCGAKLTAVPMLVLALPLAMTLARLVRFAPTHSLMYGGKARRDMPAGISRLLVRCGIFIAASTFVFSPWLLRTAVATGNPIFPEAMRLLGRGPFTEAQQIRWDRSQQPVAADRGASGRAAAAVKQIVADWRWGFLPLPVAAVFLCRRHRVLLLAALLQLSFWLCFTHLQGRFALLMLPTLAAAVGGVERRWWRQAVGVAAGLTAILGAMPMLQRLSPYTAVLGVDNFIPLLPQPAQDALDAKRPVALIGDAKAFWYQTPMSRLHYRTVFDVRATAEQSAVEHWLDPADTRDAVRVVDESELRRFARTYYGLPAAP